VTFTKKSDLGVRTLSAIAMLAVAGVALWLGGYAWTALVLAVAAVVLFEWRGLVGGFALDRRDRALWNLGGILYIGLAAAMLLFLRNGLGPMGVGAELVLLILLPVIATDIGAYFAGRAIGGPKIAPMISPSKTWAGLGGGMIAAGIVLMASSGILDDGTVATGSLPGYFLVGAAIAVIAQGGDFFESWMKRKAGVKDSSHLIPGHGGLFDRVDGLLAVCFVFGLFYFAAKLAAPD